MTILIAPDKFKDSATALEVCQALERGIGQTFPEAVCALLPLADGGEGTLESLQSALGGEWRFADVLDPLSRPISARYLYLPAESKAIIEMARASGIELLTTNERDCLITSSFGTGQLILNALQQGATEIVLTVGGTATNDAGIGIAAALGFAFLDHDGQALPPVGGSLGQIASIDDGNVSAQVRSATFTIITDVRNPFYGPRGAAHVFALQKGADDAGIHQLDLGLQTFASLLSEFTGRDPQAIEGSGAGGGVGGGLACLLNSQIHSAADWILSVNKVCEHLQRADILITGEGKIDAQTWDGKLISQLLGLAQAADVPAILICGTLEDVHLLAQQPAVIYATSILQSPLSLSDALTQTPQLLESQGLLLGKLLPALVK